MYWCSSWVSDSARDDDSAGVSSVGANKNKMFAAGSSDALAKACKTSFRDAFGRHISHPRNLAEGICSELYFFLLWISMWISCEIYRCIFRWIHQVNFQVNFQWISSESFRVKNNDFFYRNTINNHLKFTENSLGKSSGKFTCKNSPGNFPVRKASTVKNWWIMNF